MFRVPYHKKVLHLREVPVRLNTVIYCMPNLKHNPEIKMTFVVFALFSIAVGSSFEKGRVSFALSVPCS